MNLTFTGNLSYQSPGGAQVSQSLGVNQATYAAQQGGSIDVPSGSPSGLAFPLNFGAVATPIGLMVKGVNVAAGLYFNGQTGGVAVPVGTGGQLVIANPKAGAGPGIQSAVVVVPACQVAGQIDWLIFGES